MTPETPETPESISGPPGHYSGNSGRYIIPELLESPIAGEASPLRILLSETASKTLLDAGECFMIAGKTSYPEQPGRIVIHLVPIPKAQADAACGVAMGTHKATKIKPKES